MKKSYAVSLTIVLYTSLVLIASFAGCSNASSTSRAYALAYEQNPNSSTSAQIESESASNPTMPPRKVSEDNEDSGSSSALDDTQRSSLAMLNYLTVFTCRIDESKHSRLALEEMYSEIVNNTYPNAAFDKHTRQQLKDLLDILESYRMLDVKRERLEFLYEQKQAEAIREAVPNPLGLLSAVQSGDMVKLAASVAYMAVDSVTSYQAASSEATLEYLKSGWELEDEESKTIHEQRKGMLDYMMEIVNKYDLPGDMSLNEKSAIKLVESENDSSLMGRIQSLEDGESKYRMYGEYWLILAKSYYDHKDYQKCLDAIASYEKVSVRILRYDRNYARQIPAAIASASETMSTSEYVSYTDSHLNSLLNNCTDEDWELKYFAALTYSGLYAQTGNTDYLQRAYRVARENVNYLRFKQLSLNESYINEIREEEIKDGLTKKKKEEIKQYNKMLNEKRKTELPPVYQPLLMNCELLVALGDKAGINDAERNRIDEILHDKGEELFLTRPLDNRYRFNSESKPTPGGVSFDSNGTKVSLPACLVSEQTTVRILGQNGEPVPGEWEVVDVKREREGDIETFTAIYENREADSCYSDGEIVTLALSDETYDEQLIRKYRFKVTIEPKPFILHDKVTMEQMSE